MNFAMRVRRLNVEDHERETEGEMLIERGPGEYVAVCEDCDEATCQVRHMMLEVRHAVAELLDNRSLAAMRDAANDDMAAELRHQV